MSNREARPFDVVLYGATGYTGRLVAEQLAKRYGFGRDLRWAIAGRNKGKLEEIRRRLESIDAKASSLEILIADGGDARALSSIAEKTRVVCTTVGPYAIHGAPVVAACVEHGTSYCDLTGEVQFVRAMIDKHHARAKETGARIVCCCGFDSIPSDLGVQFMQDEMRARHGVRCAEVKFLMGKATGGVSGGTIASALNIMKEVSRDPSLRKLIGNPYALVPGTRGPDRQDSRGVGFDRDLGMWTAPFVMAAINTRIVRRSNALMDYAYGKDFRYSEVMSTGRGPAGVARASAITVGLGGFFAAAMVPALRNLLEKKVLPKPGQGPTKEARDNGSFEVHLVGVGESSSRDGAPKLRGTIKGNSDPGYGETAKMLAEAATCLAKDSLSSPGGVTTPAASMGSHLLTRLRSIGMTWDVRALHA